MVRGVRVGVVTGRDKTCNDVRRGARGTVVLPVALVLMAVLDAWAADPPPKATEPEPSDAGGRQVSVLSRRLNKDGAFEVELYQSMVLSDFSNLLTPTGLAFKYHFTDALGVGLGGSYDWDTQNWAAIETARFANWRNSGWEALSRPVATADLVLEWSPIYGKFSLGRLVPRYYFRFFAGPAVVMSSHVYPEGPDKLMFSPGGFVGVGQQFVLGSNFTLGWHLGDYFFSEKVVLNRMADGAASPKEEERHFRNRPFFGVDLSFFWGAKPATYSDALEETAPRKTETSVSGEKPGAKRRGVTPALQLATGISYADPQAVALLEGGFSLLNPNVSFDLSAGLVQSLNKKAIGMEIQSRFIFPSLLKQWAPLEWYVGGGAITLNTFYSDEPVKPWREYLGKTGVDYVIDEDDHYRLVGDLGVNLGAFERTEAYIKGAREETRDIRKFSGGGLLMLRCDIR